MILPSPVRIWPPQWWNSNPAGCKSWAELELLSQEHTAVSGCWSSLKVHLELWENWWLLFHGHNWSHSLWLETGSQKSAWERPCLTELTIWSKIRLKSRADGLCQEGSDPVGSVGTAPGTPRNRAGSSEHSRSPKSFLSCSPWDTLSWI